jgi:hypothetical protein
MTDDPSQRWIFFEPRKIDRMEKRFTGFASDLLFLGFILPPIDRNEGKMGSPHRHSYSPCNMP